MSGALLWQPSWCLFACVPCALRCCGCLPGGGINPGLLGGAGLAVLAAISSLGGGKGKKADQAAQKAKVGYMTASVASTISLH